MRRWPGRGRTRHGRWPAGVRRRRVRLPVTDFAALRAEWAARVSRQGDLAAALGFWTPIIDGWAEWRWAQGRPAAPAPLAWTAAECADRWKRGVSLLAEAKPELPREPIEELVGPLVERLAVAGPDEMQALQRFAEAWDAGALGPADLFPAPGWAAEPDRDALKARLGVPTHFLALLSHAGLRPALEAYFAAVRFAPDGLWPAMACPWCGGPAAYAEIDAAGRRTAACHLCGGRWPAAPACCPFCERRQPGAVVALLEAEVGAGYFVEGCRHCRRYLKGVDRRRRPAAGSALVEDWGSPHLDLQAAEAGYERVTPTLAHLVP